MSGHDINELGLAASDCVRTAFVAIDAANLLANFSEGAATALKSLLDEITPADEIETRRFEELRTSRRLDEWVTWIEGCIDRRDGYPQLGILRVRSFQKNGFPAKYTQQPWFWGWRIFDGELAGAYSYVLTGMEKTFRGGLAVSSDHEMWSTTTISLGPVPNYRFDPTDPIHFATLKVASVGVVVFVAAGNEGRLTRGNSLNPWALAKWVVCVGATNEDGHELLPTSSKGTRKMAQFPTIVAPGMRKTEFAALGHGALMAIEAASCGQVGEITFWPANDGLFAFTKGEDGRVAFCEYSRAASNWLPVAAIAQVLRERSPLDSEKALEGTSFATEYAAAVGRMIATRLNSLGCQIESTQKPKLVKAMLQHMARPMPQHYPWEVGAGVVTIPIAADYLQRLTKGDVVRLSAKADSAWQSWTDR